jgi:hypothetical protein
MSGIGGIGGIGGMGGMGGMGATASAGATGSIGAMGAGTNVGSTPNAGALAGGTPAAPGTTVSISQAAQNAFNAEAAGVGASFSVTANASGLQVTGNVTGLDSGSPGAPVSAELSVDISMNTQALNEYDELIATLILALLMQEKEKSDVTIQIM